MKKSSSEESNSISGSQEVLPLIWNTKVHHRVHNSALLVPLNIHSILIFPKFSMNKILLEATSTT